MKKQKTSHYLLMAFIVGVFAFATLSCNKDDDPSLADLRDDKLEYLEDSLRISDSLRRVNAAGVVNYTITVVNASTSSINSEGWVDGGSRTARTQSMVEGAIVTISQFGKVETDTTDESGMVVFKGFFRSAVNVTVRAEGFTTANYIAAVSLRDTTANGSISFVGNIIPLFETTGANTATITGRATIQTNLTNKTRELVPNGTAVTASIDATNGYFQDQFLTSDVENIYFSDACECEILYVGEILQAAYSTGVVGTVTNGNYSITVPAAIDELPIWLDYSDIAADQTLFEEDGAGELAGNRSAIYRTIFGPEITPSTIPSGSPVTVSFISGRGATATALVSETTGVIDRIVLTDGGEGYFGVPTVRITDESGTGAVATATVVNGKITGINLTNGGNGYINPTVEIVAGTGALASSAGLGGDGSLTSIIVTNSGSGYTSAPTVTISAPTSTLVSQVQATAVANLSNGRVSSITITNPGAGYLAAPTITLSAPGGTGITATATAQFSGQSVRTVQVTSPGQNYTFAPRVVFSAPQIATGRRATGTATINAATGEVVGITITDAGMGYTGAPTVDLIAFTSAASAEAQMQGGSVIGISVDTQGSGYTGAPFVTISGGGGSGATATAVVSNGKVVGFTITNAGSGYTGVPEVTVHSGEGAEGYATVSNGAITAVTITAAGRYYVGNPVVMITSSEGGGATATATTTAAGGINAVTMVTNGSGYLEGNTPAGSGQYFGATYGSYLYTRPGKTYINDVYYGTGERQPN